MRTILLLFCSLCASTVEAQEPGSFALGTSQNKVRAIHGDPDSIVVCCFMGEHRWWFGPSSIVMSIHGVVAAWDDAEHRLNRSIPQVPDTTSLPYFSNGGSADDVIRLHGTPQRITRNAMLNELFLWYGEASVTISMSTEMILRWEDPSGFLRSLYLPPEQRAPTD